MLELNNKFLHTQANMPDLLVKWHHDFSVNEHVEVQIHTNSDDENTLQCTNGKIIRTHDTNRVFDVALDVQTTNPSDAVIKGVPNQALRQRFLHGEIVECYQEETGWLLGYIIHQSPNAVSVPEIDTESEILPMNASAYDLFCCGKKGKKNAS